VLIDYRMKMMNGLEGAKKIRSADPLARIVLVSADDDKAGCERDGVCVPAEAVLIR
jgi:DNA-binding NarL/FixJ family response regulator